MVRRISNSNGPSAFSSLPVLFWAPPGSSFSCPDPWIGGGDDPRFIFGHKLLTLQMKIYGTASSKSASDHCSISRYINKPSTYSSWPFQLETIMTLCWKIQFRSILSFPLYTWTEKQYLSLCKLEIWELLLFWLAAGSLFFTLSGDSHGRIISWARTPPLHYQGG